MNETHGKSFLRSAVPQVIVFFMMLTVFSAIHLLARLPLPYLWYALELSSVLFLLYLLVQWPRYRRRMSALQRMQEETPQRLDGFPEGSDPADELYQRKILALAEERRLHKAEEAERRSDQLDYFTLWLHQIKTPLAALNLLVKRGAVADSAAKQAEQELLRLEDYTHMALNYVKLEEAGADLELSDTDVDAVIKAALKKYAILFIHKGISLDYEPTGLRAVTDSNWLRIMIEQILSNSLKYTPSGTITFRRDPEHEQSLRIEDTGIGIREEDLPRIFNKGYSGLNGRLHEKSTGLGLFLVQNISRRLGHRIRIASKHGKGTAVTISLQREDIGSFD